MPRLLQIYSRIKDDDSKKKRGKLNKDLLQVAFVASGGVRDADG